MNKAVPALPAATVTLVRDTPDGVEVLMLQRNHQSGFMPGMFLFPGGALDPEDQARAVLGRCAGLDDTAACAALGIAAGALAYWAAAIRESFEEAAMLLAYDESGALVNPQTHERLGRFEEYRRRLNAGEPVLASMLERENLTLAVDRMTYFSHWITPIGAPRRYDTRFFVARAPAGQVVRGPPGDEAAPDELAHERQRPSVAGLALGEQRAGGPHPRRLVGGRQQARQPAANPEALASVGGRAQQLRALVLGAAVGPRPDDQRGALVEVLAALLGRAVVVGAQERADHRADGRRPIGEGLPGEHRGQLHHAYAVLG